MALCRFSGAVEMARGMSWLFVVTGILALPLGESSQAQNQPRQLSSSRTQPGSLVFSRACDSADEKILIAAVGDILPHNALQEQAYGSRDGFTTLWSRVLPWLKAADITFGNLEGPTARGVSAGGRVGPDPGPTLNGKIYWGNDFVFNFHPRIILDLQESGFDILSLANNHTYDRSWQGVDVTIDEFNSVSQAFVGVRKSTETQTPWHTIVKKGSWKIAFLACAEMSNIPPRGVRQFLYCGQDLGVILREIDMLKQDRSIDAIIVTPHWGDEYQRYPKKFQKDFASKVLAAGADAIFGAHPHVLQPIEKQVMPDGREAVVAYSLGNFVSGQGDRDPGLNAAKKLTAILYLGLSKDRRGKTWINGVSYLPVYMERRPFSAVPLEQTNQADKRLTGEILDAVLDRTRELRAGDRVRADLGCR
jgi:hypothetical protein